MWFEALLLRNDINVIGYLVDVGSGCKMTDLKDTISNIHVAQKTCIIYV